MPAANASAADWRAYFGGLLSTPARLTLLLILTSLLARLAFGAALGLGIDESYMVATGRAYDASYFDHPPLSWWMAHSAALITGSEAPLAVRMPFILLFALSTWLMYRLGARLFSPEAGLWAAIGMNLSPVLGFALALTYALEDGGWRYWLAVGVCGGAAMLSKYTAALPLAGAGLYVLTQGEHRRWLLRPQPYAAALIAAALFLPVILWNIQHGWASFAFQGGRASGTSLHPFAPFAVLGGEALYLLPWIWAALMVVFIAAILRGPQDWRSWLLVCLGALPIVLFVVAALWSRQRLLFHWAAPGYMMLFPLLGHAIAVRIAAGSRLLPRLAGATAIFVLALALLVSLGYQFNRLPEGIAAELRDWTPLRAELKARGLEGQIFGAFRWHETGKLGYALGPSAEVICLSEDAREFGILWPVTAYTGKDVIIAVPGRLADQRNWNRFERIDVLEPFILNRDGQEELYIGLYQGIHLKP
jgi:4-amino-4-deoxy-L-arabinose transferase-like glycosyltransferase